MNSVKTNAVALGFEPELTPDCQSMHSARSYRGNSQRSTYSPETKSSRRSPRTLGTVRSQNQSSAYSKKHTVPSDAKPRHTLRQSVSAGTISENHISIFQILCIQLPKQLSCTSSRYFWSFTRDHWQPRQSQSRQEMPASIFPSCC